jgi:hypothetical protein
MSIITFPLITSLAAGIALADDINFDACKHGSPPPGWTTTRPGKGDPKREVVAVNSAPQ